MKSQGVHVLNHKKVSIVEDLQYSRFVGYLLQEDFAGFMTNHGISNIIVLEIP